jgi:cell division protein FtsB
VVRRWSLFCVADAAKGGASQNERATKQIDALTAQLKQQAAQIQKVSAQIEVRTSGPQMVKAP